MSQENVGSIVVVSNGAPEGIVTDRDLVTRVMAENGDPSRVFLHEVMSRYTAFLSMRRTLDEVIATMRDLGVRRIPVTTS
jgi:CBS domain-containing protein